MRLMEKIFGVEGDIDNGIKQDMYDEVDTDIEYSAGRAIRVAKNSSVYTNFDDQGSVSLDSGPLLDGPSQTALRETFGDMLFGDDRKNRTTPKMIETEEGITYEEIGAATIGAGLAAAKVDEVGHTPYTPAYGDLFSTVVEGNWNQNPDVASNFEEESDYYQEIVQQTAENVEEQLLDIRPEPGVDQIEEELERNTDRQTEKELE